MRNYLTYAVWLGLVLLAAWGTTHDLYAPAWISRICKLLFYRDYIFG